MVIIFPEELYLRQFQSGRLLSLMEPGLRLYLLIVFSAFAGRLTAQNNSDTTRHNIPTSGYIEKMDTIISLRLSVNSEYERFTLSVNDDFYDLRPNISLSSKISVNYRYISFSFGFTPKFIPGNNDNDLKGKTTAFSMGLNLSGKHVLQDLQALHVKGFYLYNTGDYDTDWQKGVDPYIQFPDLDVVALRGSTGYKFNENFSLKSLSSQTEIQLKSCGSFFPLLIYKHYIIDDKASNQQSNQRSENLNALASIGYAYTFVINSMFYGSLGITSGVGIHYTKLLTRMPEGNLTTYYTDPLFRFQEKISMGYNSRKLFTGLETSFAQRIHNQADNTIHEKGIRTFFQVFIGYRFTAPWFIKHEADVVKGVVPQKLQKIIE
jgi:hypothetical protein